MHDTRDLTTRLAELLHREHAALADFLIALADFDRERRWLQLGYTSLFYFLHRELGLSKGAAFYRKTAAELVQRYPEVVEALGCARRALAQPPGRRHRGRARGGPRPPPREAGPEEGAREEAQDSASTPLRPAAAHPGRGEAGGLDPRWRPLPVAGRLRRRLRLDPAARARPHRAGRSRRSLDGRQSSGDLPAAQPARGEAGVRRGVDGPVQLETIDRSHAGACPLLRADTV